MSIVCGLPLIECVYCLGCARWAWKKCLYTAGHESENWGLATPEEFECVPRLCRIILAVYEEDIRNPVWAPPGGYGINPDWVVLRRDYEETQCRAPPYLIYLDHTNHDIVLAVRGLNLAKENDYAVLLDNKLGQTGFDGGYVHNGLLKSACWLLEAECDTLKELVEKNENYTLTFAGHSLGAGVVTLLAILAVQNRDIINSVVLQDDFLPRTTTALEDVFKSLFCLPCLLCVMCIKDTCTMEEKRLKDPRRLYAPGRLYHIVERKPFRWGRFPPVVRTAVPVDGRFEHLVLSCNATSDHAIIWIERESQRALDILQNRDRIMEIPAKQRMERQKSVIKEHVEEHRAAIQRAVALDVPQAYSPSTYGTFQDGEGENSSRSVPVERSLIESSSARRMSWDNFVGRIFHTDESGHIVIKKS
uniref:Calmodulin-binding heat-shock protein n=1 Tax=Kalanchoe fedtschenkoi TaxID=63787 RepID=A0A7N0T2T4_KALFE